MDIELKKIKKLKILPPTMKASLINKEINQQCEFNTLYKYQTNGLIYSNYKINKATIEEPSDKKNSMKNNLDTKLSLVVNKIQLNENPSLLEPPPYIPRPAIKINNDLKFVESNTNNNSTNNVRLFNKESFPQKSSVQDLSNKLLNQMSSRVTLQ